MATSVLSRVLPSMLRTTPFPHLVVENVLPDDDYRHLEASFPPLELIVGQSPIGKLASNRRYSMPAWPLLLNENVSPAWKSFLETHTSAAFLSTVFAQFAGHWDDRLVPLLEHAVAHGDAALLHRDGHRYGRVLMDARIEINSPVLDAPSSARGVHLDTPNRLYSGLFYLRDEEDDSIGGDLELYAWKEPLASNIDVFELPLHMVEKVGAIPYRANQLVLFPQSMLALHGVGIRHPTPHVRRYVFITAEIEQDWLGGETMPAFMPEAIA